ncbi:hypothetical protein DTO271G3_2641 [Paecilomyces variotii]|nr:hypothetical protein DTO271G3_2641 [Paecilomyces variotii]
MSSIARLLGLCALGVLTRGARSISLSVNPDGGNASSSLLYGFMFEDINHSGDGGIHGQLLQNNGFQGDSPNLTAYAAVGDVSLAVDFDNPLTSAITRSLRVDVPSNTTGQVGFSNEGYWGIPVDGTTYTSYFFMKGNYSGDVTVKLVGTTSGIEYGKRTLQVDSGDKFAEFNTSFPTTRAPDGDVLYTLTFDGAQAAGGSLWFDLVMLYPTTYKNRYNGLKTQIVDVLNAVKGSFLRFPGGNNLEGASPSDRWKWNETVGPLENRPGREGDWTYPNTDALGLDEYFYWCEDMDLEPVLGVWAGFSLDSGGGTPLRGDALQPYIDDVLDELEYILGDSSSQYGAWRVANIGRTEPWPLTMVEIGNEDNLGGGCASYPERFQRFHDAIKEEYPQLRIIASTSNSTCLPDPLPEGVWTDYHNYNTPENFYDEFNFFDNVDRSFPYFVGEYSRWEIDWPNMQGSVSEAIWMLGMERNSDVVKMAAYAPTLNLVNSTQWTPDMIAFNQNPTDGVFLTTSYYVQQLFSTNRGDTIKEVTSDSNFGPVFWCASSKGSTYYVKLANYGQDTQSLDVTIPDKTTATLTYVANDDPNAYNSDEQHPVSPVTKTLTGNGTFTFTLPAWAVAVLAAN